MTANWAYLPLTGAIVLLLATPFLAAASGWYAAAAFLAVIVLWLVAAWLSTRTQARVDPLDPAGGGDLPG